MMHSKATDIQRWRRNETGKGKKKKRNDRVYTHFAFSLTQDSFVYVSTPQCRTSVRPLTDYYTALYTIKTTRQPVVLGLIQFFYVVLSLSYVFYICSLHLWGVWACADLRTLSFPFSDTFFCVLRHSRHSSPFFLRARVCIRRKHSQCSLCRHSSISHDGPIIHEWRRIRLLIIIFFLFSSASLLLGRDVRFPPMAGNHGRHTAAS